MHSFSVILFLFGGMCAVFTFEASPRIITANSENTIAEKFFYIYRSNMPVVLLIDMTKQCHEDALKFYQDVNRSGLNSVMLELFVMKFNTTGTSPVLASNQKTRAIFEGLFQWSDEMAFQTIGFENSSGSVLFFSVLQAIYLLPYNSGILIFASRPALDEDLAALALQEAAKKRIRLYVVWGGANEKQETVIKQAALHSGGAFFVSKRQERYGNVDVIDATKTKPLIAFRKNVRGQQHLHFPVDSHVTGIHVTLSTSVDSAVLTSPEGYAVDVLNQTELVRYWPESFVTSDSFLATHQVQVMGIATPGVWRLDVIGSREYNVTISAQTELKTHATLAEKGSSSANRKCIKVEFSDGVTKIDRVTFVDENGETLTDNVGFTVNATKKENLIDDVENIQTDSSGDNEVNIEAEEIPHVPFYIQVNGKDANGNEFTRLSYFNANNAIYTLPALTVEVGLGSELLVSPNQLSQVFFEVTNNRDQTVFVRFRCQDDKSLLVRMLPISAWLNPRQTVIVTVTTRASTSGVGYRDIITFTATGPERIEKTVIMNVDNDKIVDLNEPYLGHRYTSDCMNVLLGSCEDGSWAIEVTAQDTGAGLLQVTSIPSGLYFPNGYTAGTVEKVTGYYTGSCCQSKLQISATDRLGNRRSYTADAYYSYLSAGSISAIVLGVVLLILIVVALILLCRYCCRKRSDSVDLPSYRGPSSRRT